MENYSYSSYPDPGDSSPRSRDIEETQSWDEPPSSYKVKFMCSYGGKIQPRPHDNQLAYVGGDTKILVIDRNIKFNFIMNKLTSLCADPDICLKYQLPGEDLDALISVTNDEDLAHMMLEYDRLYRASVKPARLRLFLFHLKPISGSDDLKSDRQWFVEALNSVPVQNQDISSPPAAVTAAVPAGKADFLFGIEKELPVVPVTKFTDTAPAQPTLPEVVGKDFSAGSDDRHGVGDPLMNQQIPDLQKLQISAAQEANSRGYTVEYYPQKVEKIAPSPAPLGMPMLMPVPTSYLPERHVTSGGYTMSAPGTEQTVYQIPPPTGVYQQSTVRPMTGQVNQGYYGIQRFVQEVCREQPHYSALSSAVATATSIPQQQAPKVGVGMVQSNVGVPEQGYLQVGYDSAGRQVYYTTTQYQAAAAQQTTTPVLGTLNQDGKVQVVVANAKYPQTSSE